MSFKGREGHRNESKIFQNGAPQNECRSHNVLNHAEETLIRFQVLLDLDRLLVVCAIGSIDCTEQDCACTGEGRVRDRDVYSASTLCRKHCGRRSTTVVPSKLLSCLLSLHISPPAHERERWPRGAISPLIMIFLVKGLILRETEIFTYTFPTKG